MEGHELSGEGPGFSRRSLFRATSQASVTAGAAAAFAVAAPQSVYAVRPRVHQRHTPLRAREIPTRAHAVHILQAY